MALTEAIGKLAEVPRGLSDIAHGIARELGIRIAGENPAPYRVARDAARAAAGVSLAGEAAAMRSGSRHLDAARETRQRRDWGAR